MAGNIFADGMAAYDSTNAMIQGIQKKRADTQAAPMIASGDFGGAAKTYGAAGLADEARSNVVDQQVMLDRSAAADTRAQTEKAAEAQRKADGLLRVVDAVQAAPVGHRLAQFQKLSGTMHDLGIDPKALGAASEADLTDANLASFKALVGKAVQDYTLGGGRYNGATNKLIAGTVSLDPTKLNYGPEDASATAPPAAASAPAAPVAPPTPQMAPAPASGSPRGLRNNNPLNITGQGWDGQTGSDGKFAQFGSIDEGLRAADKNLAAYGSRHGIGTLSGVINRWAPASDNNDTASYIQTVARDIGMDPNAPIDLRDPKVRSVILHSMAKVETGQANPFATTTAAARPAADAGVPAADQAPPPQMPGMRLLNTPQKQWQDMPDGRQRNTITNKVEGTATTDEKPLSPEGVALVGAQYLRNGPDALKNMGQGKAGIGNKDAVMEWVAKTAREAGTSNPELVGRFAQNKANLEALKQNTKMLTSISASVHTLDSNLDLAKQYMAKGVGPTGQPWADAPINKLRMAVGSVDAKNLDNLLTTTANEYARILASATGTGGQATVEGTREANKMINSSMSLRQIMGAIGVAKQEAENRRLSYAGENSRLTSEISGIPQPAAAQPQAKVRKFNPATGRLE